MARESRQLGESAGKETKKNLTNATDWLWKYSRFKISFCIILTIFIMISHCNKTRQCCGSGIRCFSDPWIRDPDLGWKKSRSRIRDEHSGSYFQLRISFLGKKYLNSVMRIRDLANPISGIWDHWAEVTQNLKTSLDPLEAGWFTYIPMAKALTAA